MSRIPSTTPPSPAANQSNALADVNIDQFLNLMIAELQNQDPLDPLDNSEFLGQITQIREIGATDQLSSTLQAVLTGQNLTTAGGLIGRQVSALTNTGENVEGLVDRVSIEVDSDDNSQRSVKVHIGEQSVELDNIREIKQL